MSCFLQNSGSLQHVVKVKYSTKNIPGQGKRPFCCSIFDLSPAGERSFSLVSSASIGSVPSSSAEAKSHPSAVVNSLCPLGIEEHFSSRHSSSADGQAVKPDRRAHQMKKKTGAQNVGHVNSMWGYAGGDSNVCLIHFLAEPPGGHGTVWFERSSTHVKFISNPPPVKSPFPDFHFRLQRPALRHTFGRRPPQPRRAQLHQRQPLHRVAGRRSRHRHRSRGGARDLSGVGDLALDFLVPLNGFSWFFQVCICCVLLLNLLVPPDCGCSVSVWILTPCLFC